MLGNGHQLQGCKPDDSPLGGSHRLARYRSKPGIGWPCLAGVAVNVIGQHYQQGQISPA
jgi:hypothetical protein